MKKLIEFFFVLLVGLFFFGCASTAAAKETINLSDNENQFKEEKLRFDDWKYKGFGNELPDWVELAVNQDEISLKKIIPELEIASAVVIHIGWGENLDQAEQLAKELTAKSVEAGESLKLYDNFWVREADKSNLLEEDKTYASVYVFYRE